MYFIFHPLVAQPPLFFANLATHGLRAREFTKGIGVYLFLSNLHHHEQEGEEDHLYSSSEEFPSLLAQAKEFG